MSKGNSTHRIRTDISGLITALASLDGHGLTTSTLISHCLLDFAAKKHRLPTNKLIRFGWNWKLRSWFTSRAALDVKHISGASNDANQAEFCLGLWLGLP